VSGKQVAVIGAGIAGLAAAAELASRASVTVLDRLPVPGGVLPFDAPEIRALEQRCRSAGVQWLLGTTALRWRPGQLLAAGPGGIGWLPADHLVFAGGSRPATAAELPMAGPRLAGILPAPVAIHLAEARVTLGHRVVILGTGNWARAARQAIAGQRATVTVVGGASDPPADFPHDGLISGWTPVAVSGTGRVNSITLERDGQRHVITCDAVILASSPRPLRNVDGALRHPADHVTFTQPGADARTHQHVAACAAAAVADLLAELPR
jgi:D-hydroxyproline dehydrogenase subunit alpha